MATRTTKAPAVRLSAEDKKWQAQQDLRTIQSASEIQADPRRMAAAQKEARTQMASLNQVAKKRK